MVSLNSFTVTHHYDVDDNDDNGDDVLFTGGSSSSSSTINSSGVPFKTIIILKIYIYIIVYKSV